MELSTRAERVAKRQKVSATRTQHENTHTTSIKPSLPVSQYQTEKVLPTPLSKEQRQSLWLAALPQDELERLAAGAGNWHDVPRSNICFACKKPGEFMSCSSCPRSYHPECVESGQGIVGEGWACPACALLDTDDRLAARSAGRLTELIQSSQAHSSKGTPFSELPENTILVSGPQLKEMIYSSTGKEEPQDPCNQTVQSTKRQSSGISTAIVPSNAVRTISNDDNAELNKSKRVKLPDHSADTSHTRFIHAHPAIVHHHNKASSKSEEGPIKKRSRYSTLPTEVDEALAIINRQLEVASHSKSMLEQATTRLHTLEQDLLIERGKVKLTANKSDKDAEMIALQEELKLKQDIINSLTKRNEQLSDAVECKELKIKELEAWKKRMKMMIDGN